MATATGNRCSHDPRRPRLDLTLTGTRGKPFPWLIRQVLERSEQLYHDRALFPELGPRKRSERIEAMVLVVKAIARTLDRLTLRSGRLQPDGTVRGITMETISRWGRMKRQRAFRALWDLREAGYVDLFQPREKLDEKLPNGKPRYRCFAGIRRLTRHFFDRLGLRSRLRREQKALWEEQQKTRLVETIAKRRELRRFFRESKTASKLAERTTRQLAGAAAAAPTNPVDERAQRALAEFRRRLGQE